MAQKALANHGFDFPRDVFRGANIAVAAGSPEATIGAAKAVKSSEIAKKGKVTLRGGALEGKVLSAADALHAVTLGSAYLLGLDEDMGSIQPGKWADFAVLGPVNATPTHPDASRWAGTVSAPSQRVARFPYSGSAGWSPSDLDRARSHGAQGLAMIRGSWDAGIRGGSR
ncbi:MAG: amidohydrolase family protein [Gammaproteobacteria bacterium]|nr:amidohydrolase family protein [Gammaproteobacteria bacterium]